MAIDLRSFRLEGPSRMISTGVLDAPHAACVHGKAEPTLVADVPLLDKLDALMAGISRASGAAFALTSQEKT